MRQSYSYTPSMKHFETQMVAPEDNPNGVINVPADAATILEAVKMATPGQTILFAEGEHMWKGKIVCVLAQCYPVRRTAQCNGRPDSSRELARTAAHTKVFLRMSKRRCTSAAFGTK